MSKQIPILFSTPMVQAILEGRKTMTRRVVKPQPIDNTDVDGNFFEGNHKGYVKVDGHPNWKEQFAYEFCKCSKGDILWVKESHYRFGSWKNNGTTKSGKQKWRFYPDNGFPNVRFMDNPPYKVEKNSHRSLGWYKRNSLFMPREICRIFLQVTNVRVERLQDISEEDAVAEGAKDSLKVDEMKLMEGLGDWPIPRPFLMHQFGFLSLWCKINGCESWLQNPWVWVIEFKKTENPNL
jgi:hypothetical protein